MARVNRRVGRQGAIAVIEPLEARRLLAASPLHVDGNHLEDAAGNTVRLTGANVVSLDWQSTGDHIVESIARSIDVWQANLVRLPLNQGYWNSNTNNYRTQVANAVNAVTSRDKYVMLDLHGYGQPDANSTVFWQSVAATYANNPSVLFDLFNEPHGIGWSTWQSSMQGLLTTVRNTGANNIVVAGGLDWGFDLSGVASGAYALNDPLAVDNLMYGSHVYPMKSSNWNWAFGNLAATKPVFVGEFGEDYWDGSQGQLSSPGETFTTRLLDYLDAHGSGGISWTAWAMYPTTSPNLLQFQPGDTWIWDDWNPSTLGNIVKDRLASYQDPSAARALWGPTIGTSGSYTTGSTSVYTASDGANAAFDGSLGTAFDAPSASWNTAWVGQDLGVAHQITQIGFAPRSGFASRMNGGIFQASNTADFSSGVVTLHGLSSAPASGWQTVNVGASGAYRYVRYLTAVGGGASIAELMFHGTPVAAPTVTPVAVQDASFESPVASDGGTATRPASWTSSHGSWLFNPTNNHFSGTSGATGNLPAPADGKQVISLDLNGSNLTRTLTYNGTSLGTYEAGATYALTAAGGQRLDQPAHWQDADGVWRNHYIRFTVSLLARDNASSPWVVVDTSAETALTAVGTFADATDTYTATSAVAGKQIGIRVTVMASWTQGQVDNVRLTKSSAAPAPSFTNGDVGSPGIAGSGTLSGTTYTVKGSGSDIWNTGDQFNYHRTSVSGDRTMVARVTSLSNTHAAAKAGVMFRDSTASNATFAMVNVKPNGGVEFLSRSTTGASVAYNGGATTGAAPSSTNPIWLKLVRSGSTISAYYATGASTPASWTLIASIATVTFAGPNYLAGLAVTSHNNGSLATALFDNVGLS